MRTEPHQPTWLKPLGGILLGFTVSAPFVVVVALLVGIPWLYSLAFLAGTTLLLAPVVFYAMRLPTARSTEHPSAPPAQLPPALGGPLPSAPFSGRFGAVWFWVVGVIVVIPTFASVVSAMGRYVVAPLAAAALARWLPPDRTLAAVGLAFYIASLVFAVLFWRAAWQHFKPTNRAA